MIEKITSSNGNTVTPLEAQLISKINELVEAQNNDHQRLQTLWELYSDTLTRVSTLEAKYQSHQHKYYLPDGEGKWESWIMSNPPLEGDK